MFLSFSLEFSIISPIIVARKSQIQTQHACMLPAMQSHSCATCTPRLAAQIDLSKQIILLQNTTYMACTPCALCYTYKLYVLKHAGMHLTCTCAISHCIPLLLDCTPVLSDHAFSYPPMPDTVPLHLIKLPPLTLMPLLGCVLSPDRH